MEAYITKSSNRKDHVYQFPAFPTLIKWEQREGSFLKANSELRTWAAKGMINSMDKFEETITTPSTCVSVHLYFYE